MSTALVVSLVLLGSFALAAVVACSNDAVPSVQVPLQTEPSRSESQSTLSEEPAGQRSNAPQSAPASPAEPAEPADESAAVGPSDDVPEAESNPYLLLRLTEKLSIYHRPRDDILPFVDFRERTLLLGDGWTQLDSGELWLHLDLNGDLDGWVRLADTPLTLDDAMTLPMRDPNLLPMGDLIVPGAEPIRVRLLGMSEDGRQIAILLPNNEYALWADANDLDINRGSGSLSVYTGTVWGVWYPPSDQTRVTAEISTGSPAIFLRPGKRESGYHTYGDYQDPHTYGVLGRSLDGEWLAIVLNDLQPPVGWVRLSEVELNVDPESLPYMLSGDTEVIATPTRGARSREVRRTDKLWRWQWRDDGSIVGQLDDLVRWNPLEDAEPIAFAPSQWVVFSPDGRYAASGTRPDYESGDLSRDITITPVDGGEPITFPDAGAYYFTHHPADPSLSWSPDSRRLLSLYLPGEGHGEYGFFLLGVDGSRSELVPLSFHQSSSWLSDDTVLIGQDDRYLVYAADGTLLRELTAPTSLRRFPSEMLALSYAGRPLGWKRVDLHSGEIAQLPAPLNGGDWKLASQHLRFALFHRFNDAEGILSLASYDALQHEVTQLPTLNVGREWRGLSVSWSDDGSRLALLPYGGQGYIVDHLHADSQSNSQADVRAFPLPMREDGHGRDALVDWSPDGQLLLTRSARDAGLTDADGIATYPPRRSYAGPAGHSYLEYRLIDAETAQVLQRFRASPDFCWSNDHIAAFSPDGQWLAFSGRYTDCT